MGMVRLSDISAELIANELRGIEEAGKLEPVFDEDSPEMTEEMLAEFHRVGSRERNRRKVSLCISPETLRLAES